jgi:hypothetical protein
MASRKKVRAYYKRRGPEDEAQRRYKKQDDVMLFILAIIWGVALLWN